jgi:hypothetical protein
MGSKSSKLTTTFNQNGVYGQISKVFSNNPKNKQYKLTYKNKDCPSKTITSSNFSNFENIINLELSKVEKPEMLNYLLEDYQGIISG